jgi:hypothetical protein
MEKQQEESKSPKHTLPDMILGKDLDDDVGYEPIDHLNDDRIGIILPKTKPFGRLFTELNNMQDFVDFRAHWYDKMARYDLAEADRQYMLRRLHGIVGEERMEAALSMMVYLSFEDTLAHAAIMAKNTKLLRNSADDDIFHKNIMRLRNKLRKDLQETQGVDWSLARLSKYDVIMWNEGMCMTKNISHSIKSIFDMYFPLIYFTYL